MRDVRRGFVFEWLLKGYSATPISQAWNKAYPDHAVAVKTIESDIMTVMRELQEKTRYNAHQFRNLAMMRLETVIKALQPRVEAGELGAIDRYVNVTFKQATIMGSIMPAKLALTDTKGEDIARMTDEERYRQMYRMLDAVRSRVGLDSDDDDDGDTENVFIDVSHQLEAPASDLE